MWLVPWRPSFASERVRRRVIRWFRMQRLLDAAAAADMLTWENSRFSVDASVRITLLDRDGLGPVAEHYPQPLRQ